MTKEQLEKALDEAQDQIVDLKVDLKGAQSSYEEERRELIKVQGELDRLSSEADRLSEKTDSIITKYQEEIAAYMAEQRTFNDTLQKVKDRYHNNYLKALSIAMTIDNNGMDHFRTNQGREFLAWAKKEFRSESGKHEVHSDGSIRGIGVVHS